MMYATISNSDSLICLITSLDQYAQAGIDPAFDSQCEEFERQFAELLLVNTGHNLKG